MTKIDILFVDLEHLIIAYRLKQGAGQMQNDTIDCQLWQSREIGDEFHYVLQCPNFVTDRKNLIPKYFFNRPNTLKLSSLFSKMKPETIRKLCKLIDIINKKISSP